MLIDESPTTIHILRPWEWKYSKFTSKSCTALYEIDLEKTWNLDPLGMTNLQNKKLLQQLLFLAQTCRILYSEVMDIWYKKLEFVFYNPDQFNNVILCTRRHHLTHLSILINLDTYSDTLLVSWISMCEPLNQLPSIKTLRISLGTLDDLDAHDAMADFRYRFFKALCMIEADLEVFEVKAPWPYSSIVGRLVLDEEVEWVGFDVRGGDGEFLTENAMKMKRVTREGRLEFPGLDRLGRAIGYGRVIK
ncbi:hypothetical protein BDZ45DRAFT_744702 [Acephala macrosclerotiorum]|nr:hypothetical protein BDZ45DRAFT_744702 [Acephala macrosclerotiorum]